jgi:hypothetical protein
MTFHPRNAEDGRWSCTLVSFWQTDTHSACVCARGGGGMLCVLLRESNGVCYARERCKKRSISDIVCNVGNASVLSA